MFIKQNESIVNNERTINQKSYSKGCHKHRHEDKQAEKSVLLYHTHF